MPVWAVEWSTEQNAFHIDLLERILEINRQTAAECKTSPGYIILTVTRTYEEAHDFCNRWQQEHIREAGV